MSLVPARQIEHDLWLLDLGFQETPGVVGAYLIRGPHGHTLVETGPGSTLPALERAVNAAGAHLEDVRQLVVTHIHLDHAGGCGTLLKRLPDARLFVHPLGARHMIDPSKLLSSAARIYGEAMERLWGRFDAVPEDRVVMLQDGDEIDCGYRTLRALHTPGHAVHHIAFVDEDARTAFTGDVAGVRLGHGSYVRPPTPPPDVDVEGWHQSADRLRAYNLRALDLTHFGRRHDVSTHLDSLSYNLDAWVGWSASRLASGADHASIASELRAKRARDVAACGGTSKDAAAYELVTASRMSVDGLARYLARKQQTPKLQAVA